MNLALQIGHTFLVIAGFLAIISGFQYLKYRTPTTRWAGIFLFCLSGELFSFAVQLMKDPASLSPVWYFLQVGFFFLFSLFWSIFVIYMAGFPRRTNLWIIGSMILVSAIILVLLKEVPSIVKGSVSSLPGYSGSFFNLSKIIGQPGRYLIALFYSIGFVSIGSLLGYLLFSETTFRKFLFPMFFGTLFFYGVSILEHSGFDPFHPFYLTQLGLILISFVIFIIAVIWRFDGILPISRESVFEGVDDGVLLLDWQNLIIDINRSAQKILGVTRSEALKKPLSDFWQSGDQIIKGNSGKDHFTKECTFLLDNQEFVFGITVSRILGINQALMGSLIVLRNITSRERMEIVLHEHARELQRTNAFMEALAKANVKIHDATDSSTIISTLGNELKNLGLDCFITQLDNPSQELELSFLSVQLNVLRQVENLLGIKVIGFKLDRDQFAVLYRLLEANQVSYKKFSTSTLEVVDGKLSLFLLEQAVRLIGIAPEIYTLVLPLYANGHKLGLMGIWGKDLKESDIASFRLFANQVANVMDRAILFDEQIRHSEELSRVNNLVMALSKVASVAGSTSNSQVVLNTLGSELKQAGLECAIANIDSGGETAYLKYLSFSPNLVGKLEKMTRLRLDGFAIPQKYWPGTKILIEQVPVWYPDPRRIFANMFPMLPEKIAEKAFELLGLQGEERLVFLPLIYGNETIGVMAIWGASLKQVDSPIMSIFGSQVAGIIKRVATLELQVQRTDDLARANAMIIALSRVAAQLDAMFDLDQVFQTLGKELLTIQLSCMVGLLDESGNNLIIKHLSLPGDVVEFVNKLGNVWPNGASIPRRLWPSEQVVSEGIPFWDEDPVGSTQKMFPLVPKIAFEKAYHFSGIGFDGHICYLPMVNNEDVIGVLAMWGPDLRHEDILALSVFANQIAIAINNIRLYDQAQKEIDDRKQAEARIRETLEDKEILLKEVHHRVKNNLQVITSLLNLQLAQTNDNITADILRESQSRVRSMALIHEKLYQSSDLAHVDFEGYLHSLVNSLIQTYRINPEEITVLVESGGIFLNIDTAIPCGLIVNELVSNSLKYAFARGETGKIEVSCQRIRGGKYKLSVMDNGGGLPDDFDVDQSSSLGIKLVASLVRQIDGEFRIEDHQGACFVIDFSETETA